MMLLRKIKTNLLFLIFVIIFIITPLRASWMGVAWFWVKIEKFFPYTHGESNRRIKLKVLKWARGAGHGTNYGKNFPGKSEIVQLIFKNPKDASRIRVGQRFWVKHRAASSFSYDPKTKKHRAWSSKRWYYLGKYLMAPKTVLVRPLPLTNKKLKSSDLKLKWFILQDYLLTMKIEYKTFKMYEPKFLLLMDSKSSSGNTVVLHLTYSMSRSSFHENIPTETFVQQWDMKQFTGKKVIIKFAYKPLISLLL